MRKNTAGQTVSFQMVSKTNGDDVTSGTPTVFYTIDGGTQGTGTGTSAHEGNGQWSYAPAQAETNGNHVAFTMVLTSAISQTVNVYPVNYDPTAADLGLNNFDPASDAVANVTTVGTCTANTDMRGTDSALLATSAPTNFSALSITLAGRVDVASIEGLDATDQINAACDLAMTDYDASTKAELDSAFTDIKGGTWNSGTDTLEALRDRGDAAWTTATGFSTLTADDVWGKAIDGAYTAQETLRIIGAAAAGKASGLETTSAIYRDLNDTVNRIVATVDDDGNRTAITLNAA